MAVNLRSRLWRCTLDRDIKLEGWSRACVLTLLLTFACMPASAQRPGDETLVGVIDFHAHAGPDSRPRALNDIEVARSWRSARSTS